MDSAPAGVGGEACTRVCDLTATGGNHLLLVVPPEKLPLFALSCPPHFSCPDDVFSVWQKRTSTTPIP